MVLLSDLQVAQTSTLTATYKAQANRDAVRIAALIALYYQTRVDAEDPASVDAWLDLMIPRLIAGSNTGATRAAAYFQAIHDLEAGRNGFRAEPTLGSVDENVRKSLLVVGPYDMVNKAREIQRTAPPEQQRALMAQAKQVTAKKIASAAMRHVQAGGRDTLIDNTKRDTTALGWVRVTSDEPCYFCAMLASRGITYRAFEEDSFDLSDPRFIGPGTAKVHDNCGCSIKPVRAENDPLLAKANEFADLWEEWGAGGGDALLRFRRGYERFRATGERISFEEANKGLRAA